jgi:hypothetical protein
MEHKWKKIQTKEKEMESQKKNREGSRQQPKLSSIKAVGDEKEHCRIGVEIGCNTTITGLFQDVSGIVKEVCGY